MKTSLFDFELPPERIAMHPVSPRDASRLLVVGNELADRKVKDLPELLRAGDVLVFNDTRVIPARLEGRRGRAQIEVTLLKPLENGIWRTFARPGKRLKVGDAIVFADDFSAVVLSKYETGEVDLKWQCRSLHESLKQHGSMPLPPYIRRNQESIDNNDYQTIVAKHDGAVAAPTAGLHFTPELLEALKKNGVKHVCVTLHVGAGTFLPVKADDTNDHIMHSEYAEITQETVDTIKAAKAAGGRVVAVGTTSLRTLESAANKGTLQMFAEETNIFITPGYAFKAVDILMTNFHLPRSTLFMLVSAFAGLERMKAAYTHAIEEEYRFYSYGDACLLTKA